MHMKILLLLREPIFDRIPSLKTLVWGLSEKGHSVKLLTSCTPRFPEPSMEHPLFCSVLFRERERKVECPTILKLLILATKELMLNRYDIVMGADAFSNIVASKLAKLFRLPHVCFQLEYPTFPAETFLEKTELDAIECSRILITHDHWHHELIKSFLKLDHTKVCYLPNATYSRAGIRESRLIQDRIKEYKRKLVLHSGGFGRWFRSRELALASDRWEPEYMLVFHMSHRMDGDPYFEEVYQQKHLNVAYSMDPVNTDDLDSLISSAHVGVALYSEDELGYRASYMGLAAGKIGNYLKCGIPVIATRLPSLRYIEEFCCGVLVDNEDEIFSALKHIDADYGTYRQGALNCYRELWHPDVYVSQIESNLLQLI